MRGAIDEEETMQKIIKKLTAQNMQEIDSEQLLVWSQRIEVQRV